MTMAINQNDTAKEWGVVVHSVGSTDADIIGALHKALPVPQNQLAMKIYQAPSVLLGQLEKSMAEEINGLLNRIGLETSVHHKDDAMDLGKGDMEVCLTVTDYSAMAKVMAVIERFVGVGPEQSKAMLLQSPNVLMGQISATTVAALKQRFSGLGVDLQSATIAESRFLLLSQFLTAHDKHQLQQVLGQHELAHLLAEDAYIEHQLDKQTAERLWPHIKRFGSKVKLINQDFARFDVRLEANVVTADLVNALNALTEIPEHLIAKVIEKAPMVIKQNSDFEQVKALCNALNGCGAKFSVLPVCMQYFNIEIEQLGDKEQTRQILSWMTGCAEEPLQNLMRSGTEPSILLSAVQAHWLSHELKTAGTKIKLSLSTNL